MLLVDDLLLLPLSGFFRVLREIHAQTEQHRQQEQGSVKDQLNRLYMELETGQMTQEEFDVKEEALALQLEELGPQSGMLMDSEEEETPDGLPDDGGEDLPDGGDELTAAGGTEPDEVP